MVAERTEARNALRIVLAKVGLDGHDRGLKVVARGLRDAGFHVIYGGIWLSPEALAQTVADEDADWLGISLLSGAHLTLMPRVIQSLRRYGLDRVRIVLGGIVPQEDVPKLRKLGVTAVFGPGTSMAEIAEILQPPQDEHLNASELLDRCRQHDRSAISRVLSLLSRGTDVAAIQTAVDVRLCDAIPTVGRIVNPSHIRTAVGVPHCDANQRQPKTIAFTGNAGVGKSSLIARLLKQLRQQNQSVAVLACDPQSPVTGGALLGDRIRMTDCLPDAGVLIRSLAVPSGLQGVAPNLDLMADVLHLSGFDVVLIETVGVGQGDVAVRRVADAVVVLLQPEAGDSVQWEKAGLLEIADVVVIQKSDLPRADQMQSELQPLLDLPDSRRVPLVRVSAVRNEGLQELWSVIQACAVKPNPK